MAGHIFLISCLLAICLPIIFVQLPRFATIKEMHAEIEAETRSTVLRRRTLSPSRTRTRTRQMLRWISRSWSGTDLDITNAKSKQKQSSAKKAAQVSGGQRRHTGISRPIFQGDACANGGCSSKEEDELRKARAGKKPWDPPFRRQLSRTELMEESVGRRWDTDATPSRLRKTGRDLEARGLAMRLFPPDPVPEVDDGGEYNRRSIKSSGTGQTPQEPLHRDLDPKNQPQLHGNEAGPSREQESKLLQTSGMPTSRTDPGSLPSSLDGSPLPSSYYLPRSGSPAKTKEPASSPCRHCGHSRSASSVPQSPSVASVPPDCNACPHLCHCHAPKSVLSCKGRETLMRCKHPEFAPVAPPSKSVLLQYPLGATRSVPQEPPKATDEIKSEHAAKEFPKEIDQKQPEAVTKVPPKAVPTASSKERMPLWQVLLVTMGFIIFVVAFTVLVAHSLAWFLVYKTESRLGEVRAGLLRGGEMKLCLCGRG